MSRVKNEKRIAYVLANRRGCISDVELTNDYPVVIWKPSVFRFAPWGVPISKLPYFVYLWLVHFPEILKGSGYLVFVVYDGRKLVHYSGVAKKSFKYPFMGDGDIIIGPCLTRNWYRKKGIARKIMARILDHYKNSSDNIWFVVREGNVPSRNLVEGFGFTACTTSQTKKYWLRVYSVIN